MKPLFGLLGAIALSLGVARSQTVDECEPATVLIPDTTVDLSGKSITTFEAVVEKTVDTAYDFDIEFINGTENGKFGFKLTATAALAQSLAVQVLSGAIIESNHTALVILRAVDPSSLKSGALSGRTLQNVVVPNLVVGTSAMMLMNSGSISGRQAAGMVALSAAASLGSFGDSADAACTQPNLVLHVTLPKNYVKTGSSSRNEANWKIFPVGIPTPTTSPTTKAPTTGTPTSSPTTVAPTTSAPTTVAPTTVAPTTVAPTTSAPTTVAPTTVAPTTVAPTTSAPTTVAPTTVAPTTSAPTYPETCTNSALDVGEDGVDCGGECPLLCNGDECENHAQCKSNNCVGEGTLACASCAAHEDCESGICADGVCTVPSCDDGVLNGDETGLDCGGGCESKCGNGVACDVDGDCQSENCNSGSVCAQPTCTDGEQNGGETGQDCGGECPLCNGDACEADEDCKSEYCNSGSVCAQPTCTDGAPNGDETGEDCGGSCPLCNNDACENHAQCKSNNCVANVCAACTLSGDCESTICSSGACTVPSCDDEVANGGETDVDCGGPCETKCADGEACSSGSDCESTHCDSSICAPLP